MDFLETMPQATLVCLEVLAHHTSTLRIGFEASEVHLMRTATSGRPSSVKRTSKGLMKFFKMTLKMAGQLPREILTTTPSWCSVMTTDLQAATGGQVLNPLTLCWLLKAASLGPLKGLRKVNAELQDQRDLSFPAAAIGNLAGMLHLASSQLSSGLYGILLKRPSSWIGMSVGARHGVPRGVLSCSLSLLRCRSRPSRPHRHKQPLCASGLRPHRERPQQRQLPVQLGPHPWNTWPGVLLLLPQHHLPWQLLAFPLDEWVLLFPSSPRTILDLVWVLWHRLEVPVALALTSLLVMRKSFGGSDGSSKTMRWR